MYNEYDNFDESMNNDIVDYNDSRIFGFGHGFRPFLPFAFFQRPYYPYPYYGRPYGYGCGYGGYGCGY